MRKIQEIISKYNRIKIFHHVQPDGDCIGSQYGIYELIKENFKGKKVELITLDSTPLDFFDYTPRQTRDYSDSGFLAIIVDTSGIARVEGESWKQADELIIIDHHSVSSDGNFDDFVKTTKIINSKLSSTAVLLTRIAIENNWTINSSAYNSLATGMMTDSISMAHIAIRGGASREVQLLSDNANLKEIQKNTMVQTESDVQITKLVLSKVKMESNYNYAILKKEDYEPLTEEFAKVYRKVNSFTEYNDPNISVIITQKDDDQYIAELRSKGDFAVNDIAFKFNGGGHKNASGCPLSEDEIPMLLKEIDEVANG